MKVAQFDVNALLRAGQSLQNTLNSVVDNERIAAKEAEEQRRYDEQRAWKLEDRERANKERQAEDSYYAELSKGTQSKGGIYGDSLASQAEKYTLNPEEILRAAIYKNDAQKAREAGDTTIADKLAWQEKVSDSVLPFLQSGVGEESRPEMYDRISSKIRSQGLPIPKEAVISADQARLAEKKQIEDTSNQLQGLKSQILKDDQANAWKYINALGGSTSSSSQNKSNTSFNNDVDKGLNEILKTIDTKTKGAESTSKAVVSEQAINLYNTLIRDQGISPPVAAKIVSGGVRSEEPGWKSLWLGDTKAKLTKEQLLTILPSAMSAMDLKKDTVGNTSTAGTGNEKQQAAIDLISALNSQNRAQLDSILDRQSRLSKSSEERRDDNVTAWLQDRGLVDTHNMPSDSSTTKSTKANINKNIKSIIGINDSLVASEGVTNNSYKDGKGYSIAMGYNLHANRNDIDKDFKSANISPDKAFIAKTRPQDLVLDDGEAERLSQVSYYKYIDGLDKNLGGNLDKLSPQMQATALQMHYRGDLFGKSDYSRQLRKYVTSNDYEGLVNYISDNADSLPAPVVTRLENDLRSPVTEPIKAKISRQDNKSESSIKDLISKSENSNNANNSNTKSLTPDINKLLSDSARLKEIDDISNSGFSGRIRAQNKLKDEGFSSADIKAILNRKQEKDKSDRLISDRNYLISKRTGQPFDGKTEQELDEERGLSAKIRDVIPEVMSYGIGGGSITAGRLAAKAAIPSRGKVSDITQALPNFSTGRTPFINKNSVIATDKMNGVSLKKALERSSPDSDLINALNSASAARQELASTVPTRLSNLNWARSSRELDKVKNEIDAQYLWNGAIQAQKNGQITKERLIEIMQGINDKGLINTRKLMESLPK